jgi:hypothetical protein
MQSVLIGKGNDQATRDRAALVMDSFAQSTYEGGWPLLSLACYEIVEGGRK